MVASRPTLRKRHALQLFKTDMCKFYFQGRCENADNCPYAHSEEEVRRRPDLTRTSMCRAVATKGVCQDPFCRFAHDENELRATHGFFKMKMCGFVQSGRCKHGQNCRFAHSPEELRPAKPPPPNAEDDLLHSRRSSQQEKQHKSQDVLAQPGVDSSKARIVSDSATTTAPPPCFPGEQSQATPEQAVNCKEYIFGMMGGALQPPPSQDMKHHTLPSRRARGSTSFLSAKSGVPQGGGGGRSGRHGRVQQQQSRQEQQQSRQERQQRVVECGSSSSWNSQGDSSMTEVPHSEHGSPGSLPVTSDSSGAGGDRGISGAASSAGHHFSSSGYPSSSAAGSGGVSETRMKGFATRRPVRSANSGEQGSQSTQKVTTLLVANVPLYLTQGALLSMFEDLAGTMLRGTYDFFFCPWNEKMSQNFGYALINFPDPADAAHFQQHWANKQLCKGNRGQKALRIVKASMQGLGANLEYFSKVELAPCSDARFRPLYRDAGAGILQPLPLNTLPQSSEEQAPKGPQADSPDSRHSFGLMPTGFEAPSVSPMYGADALEPPNFLQSFTAAVATTQQPTGRHERHGQQMPHGGRRTVTPHQQTRQQGMAASVQAPVEEGVGPGGPSAASGLGQFAACQGVAFHELSKPLPFQAMGEVHAERAVPADAVQVWGRLGQDALQPPARPIRPLMPGGNSLQVPHAPRVDTMQYWGPAEQDVPQHNLQPARQFSDDGGPGQAPSPPQTQAQQFIPVPMMVPGVPWFVQDAMPQSCGVMAPVDEYSSGITDADGGTYQQLVPCVMMPRSVGSNFMPKSYQNVGMPVVAPYGFEQTQEVYSD